MTTERFRDETMVVSSEGSELIFERILDAPRALVWAAFMDPARIPRWWGPHGTTTTVVEMDVRVGGEWRYIVHAAGRDDALFHGTYLEISPPERFVRTFLFQVAGGTETGGPETFSFEDLGDRTRVTSRSDFGSPEAVERALATGMVQGRLQTWERLAAVVADAVAAEATAP